MRIYQDCGAGKWVFTALASRQKGEQMSEFNRRSDLRRLWGGRIDAIVANAGGGLRENSLQLNFFGAVATLEGLRPPLSGSAAPRAVAVPSVGFRDPQEIVARRRFEASVLCK